MLAILLAYLMEKEVYTYVEEWKRKRNIEALSHDYKRHTKYFYYT